MASTWTGRRYSRCLDCSGISHLERSSSQQSSVFLHLFSLRCQFPTCDGSPATIMQVNVLTASPGGQRGASTCSTWTVLGWVQMWNSEFRCFGLFHGHVGVCSRVHWSLMKVKTFRKLSFTLSTYSYIILVVFPCLLSSSNKVLEDTPRLNPGYFLITKTPF